MKKLIFYLLLVFTIGISAQDSVATHIVVGGRIFKLPAGIVGSNYSYNTVSSSITAIDANVVSPSSRKVWNQITTNDTITLGNTVTLVGHPSVWQPWGADSVYIKRDTGINFYVADSIAALSASGIIVRQRHPITILKTAASQYFLQGNFETYTEPSPCGVNVYLDNAVTPIPCEEADLSGWELFGETTSVTMNMEAGDSQNGNNSIRVDCITDIVSSGGAKMQFTGLTIGVTYNVSIWIKRSGSVNVSTALHSADGWAVSDTQLTGASADDWFEHTMTAEATATTTYVRLYGTTTFDLGESIRGDNVTITAVP